MQETISAGTTTPRAEVKFKTGEDLQFFQTLRKRVDAYFREHKLSKNANATMVVKTTVLISAYVLPFVAILIFNLPFLISLGLWLLMGIAMAGIGMSVMHDANHGAYSANEKVNKFMGLSLNMLGGMVYNWKLQHNVLHHTYTNIAGMDEDIDTKVIMRFSPHAPHKHLHKGQWWYAFFFYGIMTIYWGLAKDIIQYFSYKKKGLNKNSRPQNISLFTRIAATKLIYHFILLVVPVLVGIPFWQALVGYVVMHFACGTILSVVFQLAHTVEGTVHPLPDEAGNLEDSWAVHQLRTTMNFARENKWLSWYVGGLNFQVEHHLFTRICHVHYPAIAPIVKQTAEEFGYPYLENGTFGQALASHIRLLKKFGRPPLDEIMG
ncbi:MAG: acyl-CoA desaturase [Flavobacteriales bacterium]|nr:acyl-CoA desaturase [Flavobacteriales bacterium]